MAYILISEEEMDLLTGTELLGMMLEFNYPI